MKKIAFLLIASSILSCNQNKKADSQNTTQNSLSEADILSGKVLMEANCYVCHSPSAPEKEGRIAPPMIGIKMHYTEDSETRDQFINEIVAFTENPTKQAAKLHGAVERFGVMPKQQFPADVVQKIAAFMYDYEIEEPTWFKEHIKGKGHNDYEQTGKKLASIENKSTNYKEKGIEYATNTQKVLGKNLMQAMQKSGPVGAMEFCNINASVLTDSMTVHYNATIKRISDKNRNPKNAANKEELTIIENYKKEVAANKEAKPIIIETKNTIQFYAPIVTNEMCLKCHGTAIMPEVKNKIMKLYPKDLAIGYTENQVRGIWNITFNK